MSKRRCEQTSSSSLLFYNYINLNILVNSKNENVMIYGINKAIVFLFSNAYAYDLIA